MIIENYKIYFKATLKDALKKLNELEINLVLFAYDDKDSIIGTITDGDIRRGLIKDYSLEDTIEGIIFRGFRYLSEGNIDYQKIKEFRIKEFKVVPLLNSENQLIKLYNFSVFKTILPVDAVIMAGGKGQRLAPMTLTTPKPLLKIGGKAIIDYNIEHLYKFGIENQYITINYLAEQLIDHCDNHSSKVKFTMVKEDNPLGTVGIVSSIKTFENDYVIILNSDLLTNIDYEDFYNFFIDSKADMAVASIPYEVSIPYAIMDTENDQVKSFKEKPKFTYYANAGIYLIKKEYLSFIPEDTFFNATDLMEEVINSDKKLVHYPITNYWLDIGKPADFEKAIKDVIHIDFD